jgi:hypothetical protein
MLARLALLAVLAAAGGAAAAEDAPRFAGSWTINRALSQDIAAKIKDVAGPETMSGGPSWATETWFPWGTSFSEGQRLSVRDFLLSAVPGFDSVEIEQEADEIRTVHGEEASRIFYLKRLSSGTSAMGGETVKRGARIDGGQLLLESKGKDSLLRETFHIEDGRLVYMVHLEQKRLKGPLDARLVYDRAPSP